MHFNAAKCKYYANVTDTQPYTFQLPTDRTSAGEDIDAKYLGGGVSPHTLVVLIK